MNSLCKGFCRIYQKIMWGATIIMQFPIPKTLRGNGCLAKFPEFIRENEPKVRKVLIVTDRGLMNTGMLNPIFKSLEDASIHYAVFDKVVPNPTVQNINDATKMYKDEKCQALVAIGGGSSMDCAKGAGVRLARPFTPLKLMKGVCKVLKKIPPLFAIPTTSGTGSEATVASIISDGNYKYAIYDPNLIPKYSILDPSLTVGLPKHVTSTTGIDALSHAIEAYIGISHNAFTNNYAKKAIKAIFENLIPVYDNGSDMSRRDKMQLAAYEAGISFTRTNVGAIHAIAHAMGGQLHIPHGLAIAITMPHVLRWYGFEAHKPLAELADLVGIQGLTNAEKADKFIKAIEDMNKYMDIPSTINGNVHLGDKVINVTEADVAIMTKNASKEANPLYPVPKILSKKDYANMFRKVAGLID